MQDAITYKQEAAITYAKSVVQCAVMSDLFGSKEEVVDTKDMDTRVP
jgi:hypothetical protein